MTTSCCGLQRQPVPRPSCTWAIGGFPADHVAPSPRRPQRAHASASASSTSPHAAIGVVGGTNLTILGVGGADDLENFNHLDQRRPPPRHRPHLVASDGAGRRSGAEYCVAPAACAAARQQGCAAAAAAGTGEPRGGGRAWAADGPRHLSPWPTGSRTTGASVTRRRHRNPPAGRRGRNPPIRAANRAALRRPGAPRDPPALGPAPRARRRRS